MPYDLSRVTRRFRTEDGHELLAVSVQRPGQTPFPFVTTAGQIAQRFAYPSWFGGAEEPPTIETYELQPDPLDGAIHYLRTGEQPLGRCPQCRTQLQCVKWGGDFAILCYGQHQAGYCTYAARLMWEPVV